MIVCIFLDSNSSTVEEGKQDLESQPFLLEQKRLDFKDVIESCPTYVIIVISVVQAVLWSILWYLGLYEE